MRTRLKELLARLVSPGEGYGETVAHAPELPLREVLRRFWPDARPYRRWIPVLLGLIALGSAIAAAEIWIFQYVVDDVIVPGDLDALPPLIGAYLGLTLLGGLIMFADDYLATSIGERFVLAMRVRVLEHVQGLSIDVLGRHRVGDLVTRISSDVQQIETLLLSGITNGLSAIMRILFFGGALFILEPRLALLTLVIAPLFWLVARHFSRLIKRASREKRRRTGSLGSLAEEAFSNAALIQSTNSQARVSQRFRRQNEGVVEAEMAASRIHGLFTPLVDLIEMAGVLSVFALGTLAVAEGSLTVGGLLVFVAYLSQLLSPVRELGSLANTFFRALAGAERVIELLDERPGVVNRPDARRIGRSRGALELRDVGLTYPGRQDPALEGVSLSIEPGETLAVVGPSGAGKSSLVKLIGRLYDPASGSVHLDGDDLRDLELESVRRNVSILFQEAPLLHGTVAENVALGMPEAGRDEIEGALTAADAAGFVSRLPEGIDTQLGERGGSLSGGQRQRIAIARALLADAPLLVLDEPTAGLDGEARERVLAPLRRLSAERTTLIVSHDLLAVREADRIAVLDHGRLMELGTHDALRAEDGLYARLWALAQAEVDAPAMVSDRTPGIEVLAVGA